MPAQNKVKQDIAIYGHVFADGHSHSLHARYDVAFTYRVTGGDSLIMRTTTDSFQNYILIVPRAKIHGKDLVLRFNEVVEKDQSICYRILYGTPMIITGLFNKRALDTINSLRYDGQPMDIRWELRLPYLAFEKNSLQMHSELLNNPDTVLLIILCIMNDNPGIVLEICGHADPKESLPQEISVMRADMIVQMLVLLGGDRQRLVGKGYGSSMPKFSNTEINNLKTEEEREQMRMLNRRVVIRVLRTDFKK